MTAVNKPVTDATTDAAGEPSVSDAPGILGLPSPLADGRQSAAASAIRRGAARLLAAHGFAPVFELELGNGRRADIAAVDAKGRVWIVEVKSCLADFRSDGKWPDYLAFADALFFAVAPDFPLELLPGEAGIIVADRYGGEIVRTAPETSIPAVRRKAVTLLIARTAACRLQAALDPETRLNGDRLSR
jgi:hypothetical protein